MTIPTPTFQDRDYSNLTNWSLFSGAVTGLDPYGNIKVIGDGANDGALHLGAIPIDNGSGAKHSVACWFSTTDNVVGTLMAQRNGTSPVIGSVWYISLNTDGTIVAKFMSNTINTAGIASNTSMSYNDGGLRRLMVTVDGNDLNIYINGSEVSYGGLQDAVQGAGFASGVAASGITENLSSLLFSMGTAPNLGDNSAPTIWKGTTLSPAEVLEEYQLESGMFDLSEEQIRRNVYLLGARDGN